MELRCAFINVMQSTEDRLGDDLTRWSCEVQKLPSVIDTIPELTTPLI